MSDSTISNQLLTVSQLSTALNFNVKTIRNWCDSGVFPTARRVPNKERGQWRVLSDDLALLNMIDGHADNAAMLADQQTQIIELQQQLAECQASYNKLMAAYEVSLSEQDQLEATAQAQQAQITELQKYKDHYDQQRELRRSGSRRQAA